MAFLFVIPAALCSPFLIISNLIWQNIQSFLVLTIAIMLTVAVIKMRRAIKATEAMIPNDKLVTVHLVNFVILSMQ